MPVDYSKLTGKEILKSMRRSAVRWLIAFLVAEALSVFIIYLKHETADSWLDLIDGLYLTAWVFALISLLGIPAMIYSLFEGEKAELFRKNGSPDALAAEISSTFQNVVCPHAQFLITDRYIMQHFDYETFLHYEDVRLAYPLSDAKKLTLVMYDKWGKRHSYEFAGSSPAETDPPVNAVLARLPVECLREDNAENQKYIREHAEKLG